MIHIEKPFEIDQYPKNQKVRSKPNQSPGPKNQDPFIYEKFQIQF